MKRLDLMHWIMLAIILILGFYLWISPYQYKRYAELVVRINRITGEADLLKLDGWKRMEPKKKRPTLTLGDLLDDEPKPK